MDIHKITTDVLLFDLVLYGCLPLWLIMGFVDYVCHRHSKIETSTGINESILHAVMGVQVGVPIFLGLFFKINALVYLIMFSVLILHEIVAHHDVKLAQNSRPISLAEVHAHSFLEVLPFAIVALIVCINWSGFVDFITLHWQGNLVLEPKPNPLEKTYIAGYVTLMLVADVIPF